MYYGKVLTKRLWILTFVMALLLGGLVLASPRLFAQSPDGAGGIVAEKSGAVPPETRVRQYGNLIGSVLDFVYQQFVDVVDPEILYRGAMKGMLDSLEDPYSAYLDANMMRDVNDVTKGNFGGVGLSISKPIESTPENPAYAEVASPLEDTPGWKAGLQTGDIILSVDGQDTQAIGLTAVVELLRGPAGTPVELVVRRGRNIEFPVTLVRSMIEVPTVKYGMIGDVGYIRIIEFSRPTAGRVQEALDSFVEAGYKGLVIDLRNNPGGLITSVVDVADKFIDSGVIVYTKSRLKYDSITFTANAKKTTVPKGLPTAVLINRGSASASEILSGALKDYHLAYLVGERTYGKGSVQKPIPLPNSDGIKITTARYYTPTDTNIDKIGIPPDRELKLLSLSEGDEKIYMALIKSGKISEYVKDREDMAAEDITRAAEEFALAYPLEARLLRRLIRMEVNRMKPAALYDLDYDTQLAASLEIVHNENFDDLMRNTKTLQDLQEEADLLAGDGAAAR
ncbi:MAG: S41 family peptidase [Spirochaetaceae bacterium]|jgi:carboxyl-terminal processing protease|nr:S41 family peptidase [Spirochaetaceae bacterium]